MSALASSALALALADGVLIGCGDDLVATSATTTESTSTTDGVSAGATSSANTTSETTVLSTGEETTGPKPAICGDGVVDPGEACDDGDDDEADGCSSKCAITADVKWTLSRDGGAMRDDQALDVAIDPSGRIVVVGFKSREDQWVMMFDPAGELLWERTFAGDAGLFDFLGAVAIDDEGMIVVGGGERTSQDAVTAVIRRLSGDGELLWSFADPMPSGMFASVEALALADGAIVGVGAEELGPDVGVVCPVRRIDRATGALVWETNVEAEGKFASCIGVARSGATIVAVGLGADAGEVGRALVATVQLGDGAVVGVELDEAPETRWSDIAIGPDGERFLVGSIFGASHLDMRVRRITAMGEVAWTDLVGDAPLDDEAYAVEILGDGGAIVGGYTGVPGTLIDAFVRRYDAAGEAVWTSTYDNPEISLADLVRGLALGPGCLVAVGKEDKKGEDSNAWVRAFGLP